MTATNETYLPTYEELSIPPINLTSSALKAGAFHLASYCDKQSKEFMLCKYEEKDPRKCLKYNIELSACASEFFNKVKDNCAESFTDHWKCLDNARNGQMSYKYCRKTQAEFDNCVKEKLNWSRPEIGWISRVKLFDSERPKPVYRDPYPTLPEPPTSIDQVPEAKDSLQRTGGRAF